MKAKERKYNRLAEHRKRMSLTQTEVAKLMDVTESTVSYHEGGNRGLTDEMIGKYAKLYKVKTHQLFFEFEEFK